MAWETVKRSGWNGHWGLREASRDDSKRELKLVCAIEYRRLNKKSHAVSCSAYPDPSATAENPRRFYQYLFAAFARDDGRGRA